MTDPLKKSCTAFAGHALLMSGPLAEVSVAARRAGEKGAAILIFDDDTGRVIDLDPRGDDAEMLERLSSPPQAFTGRYRPPTGDPAGERQDPKGRGRPKLGVVAREVTLLPRQWEWLAAQPGGASAALRRLVEDARKTIHPRQQRRAAQEAAYRFMLEIAGDLPGYEEATRALFADDRPALEEWIADWPEAVRRYALRLAFGPSDESRPS